MKITIVAFINIALNFILIPNYGYVGAAYATLISQIILFLLIYLKSQELYSIPYEIDKIFKIVILSII